MEGFLETLFQSKLPDFLHTLLRPGRPLANKPLLSLTSAILILLPALNALCAPKSDVVKPVVTAYVFTQGIALKPDEVNARKLTRVNYAFANIDKGRIIEGSP